MKNSYIPRELVEFLLLASDKVNNTMFRDGNSPVDLIIAHNMFRLSACEFTSTKQESYQLLDAHVPYLNWLVTAIMTLVEAEIIVFEREDLRKVRKVVECFK